jgi:hypothetical protein
VTHIYRHLEGPAFVPYLDAWRAFCRVSGFTLTTTVPPTLARYAIRLKKTGRFGVEAYTDPSDYLEFDTLVAAWHVAAKYHDLWPRELALAEAA